MALRGKRPEAVHPRLKALFYGAAGVGKTTACIQFPRPYLIDTERGAERSQYVDLLAKAGGVSFFTTDFDELLEEVKSLMSERHEYRTLVIDPLTVPYMDMLDRSAEKVGTDFGRHKAEPDRKVKRLLSLLLNLDMNVIITSHAKPNWVRAKDAKGKDTAVQEGNTFDCYGRLDYVFDLVVEVVKVGDRRMGAVRKTRIEGFSEGEMFPFSYAEFASRYGADVMEAETHSVDLATDAQLDALRLLLQPRNDGDELVAKWLKRAKVEDLSDMPADSIDKCISMLQSGKAVA